MKSVLEKNNFYLFDSDLDLCITLFNYEINKIEEKNFVSDGNDLLEFEKGLEFNIRNYWNILKWTYNDITENIFFESKKNV